MEPPAKRLRISRRDEPEWPVAVTDTTTPQIPPEYGILRAQVEPYVVAEQVPTKTFDIFDLTTRNPEQRGVQPKRNAAVYLVPRAPDVTVTANVVNIAILDGSAKIGSTEIPAPTAETVLPISSVGTVTLAGLSHGVSALNSALSIEGPVVSFASSSSLTSTGTFLSSSASMNTTSTGERTVTVTATSTLQVSVRNGTVTLPSSSHHKTVLTAQGSTTTIDDTTSTDGSSWPVSGDYSTSSFATLPTNTYGSGGAATTTTSSAREATSTDAGSGDGVVLTPQQQQVVGGVVGGVAGVALVLLGILYFLKWYRQRLKAEGRLPEQSSCHRQLSSGDDLDYMQATVMNQPSGSSLVPMASFKQSMQRLRPHSAYTLASTNTNLSSIPAPDSKHGFQRVSGRRIPSVLLTGGDGFGGRGPVSTSSKYSSYPRSREVSQISSFHENDSPTNPFLGADSTALTSGRSTPTRGHVSPFLDPPTEGHGYSLFPLASASSATHNLASRSQLSIQTAGLSVLHPTRPGDGNVTIRPSPARTPTTTSPTSSNLILPMQSPPLMSADIPEMPPLNPTRFAMGVRTFSEDALSVQRNLGPRSISRISMRSSSSVGGKFREDI